jgi:ABC-type glycerol-3-phosphate transport system permease component
MVLRIRARWFARLIMLVTTVLVLLPLIYQLGVSLKLPKDIFDNPIIPFTIPLTLDNYRVVVEQLDVPRFLFNSLAYSFGVTLGQLALAIPAAFAFAYYQFRLKNVLLALVLVSLMVPFVVTYIPNYLLIADWKLINSVPGMILPMLGVSLGFGIFLLRQHFLSFPREVLDAAKIDGADSRQILTLVLLPANRAAVVAVGLYVLINTWNQYIWPSLVARRPTAFTLTVAVQTYFTSPEGGDYWGGIMAASVLTSLPTITIFFLMRKQILRTFVEGAVKG